MAITREFMILVSGDNSKLNSDIIIYQKDYNMDLLFEIKDIMLSSLIKNYANYNVDVTLISPAGVEVKRTGQVVDDKIKFTITKDLTDDLEEIGTYGIQFHITDGNGEFSIPPFTFRVKERLKGKPGGGEIPSIPVTSVSLNKSSHTFTEYTTLQLSATVLPSNATNKNLIWSSSNSNIASVNNGLITAKTNGSAIITVTTVDGNKTATCNITVNKEEVTPPPTINVTSVSLDKASHTFTDYTTLQLMATVLPSNATNKHTTWASSNPTIASVSTNGLVTAKSNGNATITVQTTDGAKRATCNIIVNKEETAPPPVGNDLVLTMSNNIIKTLSNKTYNLIAIFSPIDFEDKTLTWSSSNSNVATVTDKGVVTTKTLGNCTITAIHTSGAKCTCNIEVLDKLANGDPTIEPINISVWNQGGTEWNGVDNNDEFACTSAYTPIKGDIIRLKVPAGMIWSKVFFYQGQDNTTGQGDLINSGNATIEGQIYDFGVPYGTDTFRITCVSQSYKFEDSLSMANRIEINGVTEDNEGFTNYDKYKSNGVILNTRHITLKPSDTYQLNATETPLGATNGLTYASFDTSIATISANGLINAKGIGVCNIQVKNNKGESELVEVIVENVVNNGTQLSSLANAIASGGEYTGNGNSCNVSSATVTASTSGTIIRNATFNGSSLKNVITINGGGNITFEDCTFNNVGFFLSSYVKTLKTVNCTFKNWQKNPIYINSGATVDCSYTTFKDAKPSQQEWIANDDWVRFKEWNPIEVVANNVTVKVNKCTFNNIMARCIVHWQRDFIGQTAFTGGVIEFNDNTIHTTEGHCVNMESPCVGNALGNHFSFVGELRGAFGESSLVGESPGNGVGGNAIFTHGEYATYCDMTCNYNKIRYAMENGIEGGFKEIAYNTIEYMGYRYRLGYNNPSMEGIWGSARNGIHDNVIVNPAMDGIRIQLHGTANNVPCNIHSNIMIYNNNEASKLLNNTGITAVSSDNCDRGVNAYKNTIIGFAEISRIDNLVPNKDFDIQINSEYAY